MKPALALMASVVLTAALGAQTFKSRVESVRLDVLVTAGGEPVQGLSADDFEVRDNGERQQVTMIAAGALPLDVVLALDMSASLTPDRLDALRTASSALLDALEADDRAALATFSHAIVRRQPLTHEHDLVRRAMQGVAPSGATSLIDAMYAAMAMTTPGDRRTLLIVFSDGIDTSSWLEPDAVIAAAQRSETVIYAVATAGSDRTTAMLRDVTTASGGQVFEVDSRRLGSAFITILNEFRQRYLLTYSLAKTPSPGWHRIDVRVKKRGANVKARPGYRVAAQ